MNLNRSFRRFVASVSLAGLFLSATVTPVLANHNFSDVPSDHWAHEFVGTLVEEGVINGSNPAFRPDDAVNRAELVKMVIEKTTGIMDNLPTQPTFDDVAPGEWYFPYVETAVAQGIVQGYQDASGNLTGLFGPSDVVTRSAGAKIIAGGLGLPTYEDPAAPFSDVSAGAWYAGYVATVYNWSVVDGYKNAAGNLTGFFGPADPVTRAQMAKMLVNAQTPVDRHAGVTPPADECETDADCAEGEMCESGVCMEEVVSECDTDEDCAEGEECTVGVCRMPSTGPAESGLEVTLSPLTPVGQAIPKTAFNVNYLTLEVTNNTSVASSSIVAAEGDLLAQGGEDLEVRELVITRRGVGNPADFAALNIFANGRRMGSSRTFNQQTNQAPMRFPSTPLVAPRGDTVIIDVRADIDSDGSVASGSESYFSIMSAGDVTAFGASTGGTAPVVGDFPISGETMRILDVTGGTIDVDDGTTPPTSASIGENDVNVGQIKFEETSGEEDVCIDTLLLENKGTVGAEDVSNISLFDNSTGEKLAGPVTLGSDDRAFFDLRNLADGCLFLEQGRSRRADIALDINDGQDGDTIKFGLDEPSDVVAHGFIYNAGVRIEDSSGGDFGTVTVEGGDITFDFENPNFRVPINKDDVILATLNMNNFGEPVLIRDLTLTMERTRDVAASLALTADLFSNFELVTTDGAVAATGEFVAAAGQIVSGPVDLSSIDTVAGTAKVKFADDFEVAVGEHQFLLRADSEKDVKDGEKYKWSFTPATPADLRVEGLITGDDIATADLQSAEISTGDVSVEQEDLNVILANTPVSDTIVRGNQASILGIILRAGDAGPIRVTNLVFAQPSGTPATASSSSDITEFMLVDATGKVVARDSTSGTESGPSFDKLNINIPAGDQRTFYVHVRVSTSAVGGVKIAQSLTATSTFISAENSEGDTIEGGQLLGNGVAGATINGPTPTRVFTVAENGSLEVNIAPSTPDAAQIMLGSLGVPLLVAELEANNEAITIEKIVIAAETTTGAQQIGELTLFANNQPVATTTFENNLVAADTQFGGGQPLGIPNRAAFNLPSPIIVGDDQKVNLTVRGDFNIGNSGQATSGQDVLVYIHEIEARGSKEDVYPVLGQTKTGTGSISGLVVTGPTDTTLTLTSGGGFVEMNVGDVLYLNDGTRTESNAEQAVVVAYDQFTGDITVERGANRTTPLSATFTCNLTTGTVGPNVCTARDRVASDPFFGYNTLLRAALHPATIQGNVGQPTTNHDLLVTTFSAAENTRDNSLIEAHLGLIRYTVTGSAKMSGPLLRNYTNQTNIVGVVFVGGAHVGQGATELVADLTGVTNTTDYRVPDGDSLVISLRAAGVSSAGADGNVTRSLQIQIQDLGGDPQFDTGFYAVEDDKQVDVKWFDVNKSTGSKAVLDKDGLTDGSVGQVVNGIDQATDNVSPAATVYLNTSDTGFIASGPVLQAAILEDGKIYLIFDQNVFSDASGATIDSLGAADITESAGTLGTTDATLSAGNRLVIAAGTVVAGATLAPTAASVFGAPYDVDGVVGVEAASGIAALAGTPVTVTTP